MGKFVKKLYAGLFVFVSAAVLVVACGGDDCDTTTHEMVEGKCQVKKKATSDSPATSTKDTTTPAAPSAPAPEADEFMSRDGDVITFKLDVSDLYAAMNGGKVASYDQVTVRFSGGWKTAASGKLLTDATATKITQLRAKVTGCVAQEGEYEVKGVKLSVSDDKNSLIFTFPNGTFNKAGIHSIKDTFGLSEHGTDYVDENSLGLSGGATSDESNACFRFIYAAQNKDYEVPGGSLRSDQAPTATSDPKWESIKTKKIVAAKDPDLKVPTLEFFLGDPKPNKPAAKFVATGMKYFTQVALDPKLAEKIKSDADVGQKDFKTKLGKLANEAVVKKVKAGEGVTLKSD